jgi:aminopeptidase-like protein
MMNVYTYCDGSTDLLEVSERCEIPFERAKYFVDLLLSESLLRGED